MAMGLGLSALHVSSFSGIVAIKPGIVAAPIIQCLSGENTYQTARYTYQLAVRLRGGVATYMIVRMFV